MKAITILKVIGKASSLFLFALFVCVTTGCDNLLDVDNPNNVLEENLNDPAAANSIVNGALSTVSNGIGYCLAPYTTATDEASWRGSRDAWNQLDRGNTTYIDNEFVDAAWPYITEARYTADKAVQLVSGFNAAGTLKDPKNFAKAYLYAALARLTIGDMFDDFVYSEPKQDNMPPIGEANMSKVYDEAIANLDLALPIAQTAADAELQRRILGLRARAKQAKAIWGKVNPRPLTAPANPYVTEGADDAQAALALMAKDYRWQLQYPPEIGAFNEWAWEVVGRSEMRVAPAPNDIITPIPDPRIAAETADFLNRTKWKGNSNSAFTVISEREMHLIIAESELFSNPSAALNRLNAIRARNNIRPDSLYMFTDVSKVDQLLQHERRANLFMMGRRLADLYRFGLKSPQWVDDSDAVKIPGSFFPITIQERRANKYFGGK